MGSKTWHCKTYPKGWYKGYMGVSQNQGYHFGGPNNKDYNILGSILGSLYLGNYHIKRFDLNFCQRAGPTSLDRLETTRPTCKRA